MNTKIIKHYSGNSHVENLVAVNTAVICFYREEKKDQNFPPWFFNVVSGYSFVSRIVSSKFWTFIFMSLFPLDSSQL